MNISVLGAGTWGCALASLLVHNGHSTTLWSAIPEELDIIKKTHEHIHLKGAKIPDGLILEKDLQKAIQGSEIILFVVPSEFIRSTAKKVAPYITDGQILISAAKGIEKSTLKSMTDIIEDEIKSNNSTVNFSVAALSGPTHAEEVALKMPTSIVAACENENVSLIIAEAFKNSCMRVYTNTDVKGVELAGALKNIVAIAAGINRGMGFGDNALAMLITRGAAEITRIGLAMGCKRRTFMGLAGIGDLIVTCTSKHSRNNRCGQMIGEGLSYKEASQKIGMVVEGYHALEAAVALSNKYDIEMPITQAVYDVIFNNVLPSDAMIKLMNRDIKNEIE